MIQHLKADRNDKTTSLFLRFDAILYFTNQKYLRTEKYSSEFYTNLEFELFKMTSNHSINLSLDLNDRNGYFNLVLNNYFTWLGIHDLTESSNSIAESQFRENFNNQLNVSTFKKLIMLLSVLTNKFSDPVNIELINLRSCLYFLSFLIHETELNSDLKVTNDINKADSLKSYLRKELKTNYELEVGSNFIIRHRLFGFRQFIDRFMFDSNHDFTKTDLEILNLIKGELKDKRSVYFILKTLNRLHEINPIAELKSETEDLFWSVFDQLSLDEKLDVITDAFTNHELLLNENSLSCLFENQKFNNEFTIVINQLSAKNYDDVSVR